MKITFELDKAAPTQLVSMFNMAWNKQWEPKDNYKYNNKMTIVYGKKSGRR